MFSEDPHAERADELENEGGWHVLHTIHHTQCEPPERRAYYYAAGHRE